MFVMAIALRPARTWSFPMRLKLREMLDDIYMLDELGILRGLLVATSCTTFVAILHDDSLTFPAVSGMIRGLDCTVLETNDGLLRLESWL